VKDTVMHRPYGDFNITDNVVNITRRQALIVLPLVTGLVGFGSGFF